jgi:hypothetical protein
MFDDVFVNSLVRIANGDDFKKSIALSVLSCLGNGFYHYIDGQGLLWDCICFINASLAQLAASE